MYDYLDGRPVSREPSRLILDVGGIGYELAVPLGSDFEPSPGDGSLMVWTHLVVREDAHTLYGFPDTGTRDLFRTLLRVRGVGPGLALAVLSGMNSMEFYAAIAAGDRDVLTRIKGVGKRTADQIMLDLSDRIDSPADSHHGGESDPDRDNREAAVAALVSIGYPQKEARSSVERAKSEVDGSDLQRLIRAALRS